MLPLDIQNEWRNRYRRLRPSWFPSGEVYEATIRGFLDADMRMLDLGCGRGGIPEKLVNEPLGIFGVDAHWDSLAGYRCAQIHLCSGDSVRLPYPTGTFQIVIAAWLMEHLDTPQDTLLEIRRVLKPGGHFIFLTPNGRNPLLIANRLSIWIPALQRALVPRIYGRMPDDTFPPYYRANTIPTIQRLAHESKLRLISLEVIRDPTYLAFNEFMFRALVMLEDLLPRGLGAHLVGILQR